MESQAQQNLKGSVRLGNYLRRLRTGYGYSLRRVEERARAEGGEIDNSQLSRYEKGICYPSFDKLRVLAGVFNIPVQAFSDVVDLEAFEELKPETGSPETLIKEGHALMHDGDLGRAFAHYEKALEILQERPEGEERTRLVAAARISLAAALSRLGKLALAERELRQALRGADLLDGALKAQALLSLANLHADQGDLFLAELEGERAQTYARSEEMGLLEAQILHTLARVVAERGQQALAIERYRDAAARYEACGCVHESIRVRINVGLCYVGLGKYREAIRLLREALDHARSGAFRRLEAHAWTTLGEAYYRQHDPARAQASFNASNALANSEGAPFKDLLFINGFYEWKMAGEEENPTREKIAFGRLKALRSAMERRLPEVEAFDAHVERGRSDA